MGATQAPTVAGRPQAVQVVEVDLQPSTLVCWRLPVANAVLPSQAVQERLDPRLDDGLQLVQRVHASAGNNVNVVEATASGPAEQVLCHVHGFILTTPEKVERVAGEVAVLCASKAH